MISILPLLISIVVYGRGALALLSASDTSRSRRWFSVRLTNSPESFNDANSILMRVSYDGRHFTGWSSANEDPISSSVNRTTGKSKPIGSSSKRRRRKKSPHPSGYVRSVQGVLQKHLAKIYGDVDPKLVVLEGCSRTDKGVHATGLVAQLYCRAPPKRMENNQDEADDGRETSDDQSSMKTKKQILPLPRDPRNIAYCLNRMCKDVQITSVSSIPEPNFHPSTSAVSKTYRYSIAVGPHHDPTRLRTTWYVGKNPRDNNTLLEERMQKAADILTGCHDFRAFRGAPRGASDARRFQRQSTLCTIHSINISAKTTWQDTITFSILVKGDRFLYKMVRWIVGAIVAVGLDDATVECIQTSLQQPSEGQNRWQCAPARGLVLEDVQYPYPIEWTPTSC